MMTEERFCDTPHAERTITLGKLRERARETGLTGVYFVAHFGPDLEAEVLDLPNFTPVERYKTMKAHYDNERGCVEWFRLVMVNDIPAGQWAFAPDEEP